MNIKHVNLTKVILDAALDKLKNINKPTKIIWFGVDSLLVELTYALKYHGKQIDYIIDNNPSTWGNIYGTYVLALPVEQVAESYGSDAVFLLSSNFAETRTYQLLDLGISEDSIFVLPTIKDAYVKTKDELQSTVKGLRKMTLRETQLAMLENLKAFRDFCNKHNLRYFMYEGTLLGAIRHKGFIPWDDDLDIGMPDVDYDKFIELYEAENNGRFKLLSHKNYPSFPGNVLNFMDTTIPSYTARGTHLYMQNLSISILRMIGYHSDKEEFKMQYNRNELIVNREGEIHIFEGLSDHPNYRDDLNKLKTLLPFDEAELVGNPFIPFFWQAPRYCFDETIEVEFEGEKFTAPKGYDVYLTNKYGDYMTPPPPDKQKPSHGAIAWWPATD